MWINTFISKKLDGVDDKERDSLIKNRYQTSSSYSGVDG